MKRYPGLGPERFTVLPFGAPEADMDLVGSQNLRQNVFDPADGCRHWVYLGRGGADMGRALRGLFLALRTVRESNPDVSKLRLHFVGTSYAVGYRADRTIEPVAQECGVADLVSEQTERIPYLEGLALLQSSDVVLAIGSDDATYSASKVYPCILARRPLLAVLHEDNLPAEVIRRCRAGSVVTFSTKEAVEQIARRIEPELRQLIDQPRADEPDTDWAAFELYTAREMTRRQCKVFEAAVGRI
jgi:hypothetical protein